MESNPKLGQLITTEEKRDAIHFAVAPVTCGPQSLKPGWFVKFHIPGNTEIVRVCEPADAVGIIDPFLTVTVHPGESCWMMLMPNTITSLRHEWSHPAFEQEQRGVSEFWLREFAQAHGLHYGNMIDAFERSDTMGTGDNELYLDGDEYAELARHLTIVLGREIEQPGFSCAC